MYRHEALSAQQLFQLDLDQLAIDDAVRHVKDHAQDTETQTLLDDVAAAQVGYVYADQAGNPRVIRPGKDDGVLTTVFVDDLCPLATINPPSRRRPQYHENVHTIFVPCEARASSVVLGAVLLHEAVHAQDARDPNHEVEAAKLLQLGPLDEMTALLSEIKAFTLEAKLLESLFGTAFTSYLQSEVDQADQLAIASQEQHGGLLIEVGITPSLVKDTLTRDISFVSRAAEDFAMGMLLVALPIAVSLRTIDQICDRNSVPDSVRKELKVSSMSDYYDLY